MSFSLLAQVNLVPNHSFEEYYECPYNNAQLEKTKYWFSPNKLLSGGAVGMPDYFNKCSNDTVMSVPKNLLGFQNAFEGNAYVGIAFLGYTYPYTTNNHTIEYISIKLNEPLKEGCRYKVEFYISLSNRYNIASSTISVLFTDNKINEPHGSCLCNYAPQLNFYNQNYYTDTLNWTKIEGEYNCDESGLEYLTIGSFKSKNDLDFYVFDSTIIVQEGIFASYYYIDNIWLYKIECEDDSLPPPASDSSLHYKLPNVISPNADGLNDAFVLESRGVKEVSVTLYNRWGELVQSTKYNVQSIDVLSKTQLWDATHNNKPAPQGVYYYIIELSTKTGEVIIEKGTVTVL
jgi:gliding motility-associated-like protein